MKRLAYALVCVLMLAGCWRPDPDGVVRIWVQFDTDVTPHQRDVAWAEINRLQPLYGYVFSEAGGSDRLYIHGDFPANDNYPACWYVDHATSGADPNGNPYTWRGDVYVFPGSPDSCLTEAIDVVLNY